MALTDLILRWVDSQPPHLPAKAEGGYDRAVDALNRLPRPFLAFGTLALLVWAMLWPEDFALRMQALEAVPEPLWWLMGVVVAFYFGARETHYLRSRATASPDPSAPQAAPETPPTPQPSQAAQP